MSDQPSTRVTKTLARLQNHPLVALLLVFGIAVIALGSFTDALEKIWKFTRGHIAPTSSKSAPATILLLPANPTPTPSPPPLEYPKFETDTAEYSFGLGGNGMRFTYDRELLEKGVSPPVNQDFAPFKLYLENDFLFVNADVRVGNEGRRLILRRNKLTPKAPNGWDVNSTNRAIEVVDEKMNVLFQLVREDRSLSVIKGLFVDGETGDRWLMTDSGAVLNPPEPDAASSIPFPLTIRRVFKYPAWQHPGEYEITEEVSKP